MTTGILDHDEHAILADQDYLKALRVSLLHDEMSDELRRLLASAKACGRWEERRDVAFVAHAQEEADAWNGGKKFAKSVERP